MELSVDPGEGAAQRVLQIECKKKDMCLFEASLI